MIKILPHVSIFPLFNFSAIGKEGFWTSTNTGADPESTARFLGLINDVCQNISYTNLFAGPAWFAVEVGEAKPTETEGERLNVSRITLSAL